MTIKEKLPTLPNFNPTNKRDFKHEEKRKCTNCGKRRLVSYIEKYSSADIMSSNNDKKTIEYKVLKCTKCGYSNYNPIQI